MCGARERMCMCGENGANERECAWGESGAREKLWGERECMGLDGMREGVGVKIWRGRVCVWGESGEKEWVRVG